MNAAEPKSFSARVVPIFISICVLIWMTISGFFAPCLLGLGLLWLMVAFSSLLFERRLCRGSLSVSLFCLGFVLFAYYVPLWNAESRAATPEDFVRLAERYRTRGQILGDRTKTRIYYIKAAEAGNVEAQYRLGEGFYFGHYGVTNRDEGVRWLKTAARSGHRGALQFLASIGIETPGQDSLAQNHMSNKTPDTRQSPPPSVEDSSKSPWWLILAAVGAAISLLWILRTKRK